MDIIISNSSSKPIYEQISSQIKNLIISGELKPGDALPSMRLLAKELRISVITTKRAYDDLEKEGFIHSRTWERDLCISTKLGTDPGRELAESRRTPPRSYKPS